MKILLSILLVALGVFSAFQTGKESQEYHDKELIVFGLTIAVILVTVGCILMR